MRVGGRDGARDQPAPQAPSSPLQSPSGTRRGPRSRHSGSPPSRRRSRWTPPVGQRVGLARAARGHTRRAAHLHDRAVILVSERLQLLHAVQRRLRTGLFSADRRAVGKRSGRTTADGELASTPSTTRCDMASTRQPPLRQRACGPISRYAYWHPRSAADRHARAPPSVTEAGPAWKVTQ
jgi:hypothetical protein